MAAETADIQRLTLIPGPDEVFGCTPGMRVVRMEIEEAALDDLPVLIEGESGTGKEVIARYLHLNSRRRGGPFVRVNCAAIQQLFLNSELFGGSSRTVNGSDCGPDGDFIEMAAGGTLFLDGVAGVDWRTDRRLEKVFEGAAAANARIVCATRSDQKTAERSEPLSGGVNSYFGHRLRMLPLRERKQDIPLLCEYLAAEFARNLNRPVPKLSSYALEALQQWNWPGNIRELENWIARIVIFGTDEAIGHEFRRQTGVRQNYVSGLHRAVHGNLNRRRRSGRHT